MYTYHKAEAVFQEDFPNPAMAFEKPFKVSFTDLVGQPSYVYPGGAHPALKKHVCLYKHSMVYVSTFLHYWALTYNCDIIIADVNQSGSSFKSVYRQKSGIDSFYGWHLAPGNSVLCTMPMLASTWATCGLRKHSHCVPGGINTWLPGWTQCRHREGPCVAVMSARRE